MKTNTLFYAMAIAGGALLASCGSGTNNRGGDSTGVTTDSAATMPSDTATMRDTAPGAEMPPGAINPGEDSARYGTGVQDSSRNRSQKE